MLIKVDGDEWREFSLICADAETLLILLSNMSKLLIALSAISLLYCLPVQAGVPIVGLQSGPTPFQSIFATGFSGSYNTFGTGTTAGAIGAYGRFVSGGANSGAHGGGGGGGGYGRK